MDLRDEQYVNNNRNVILNMGNELENKPTKEIINSFLIQLCFLLGLIALIFVLVEYPRYRVAGVMFLLFYCWIWILLIFSKEKYKPKIKEGTEVKEKTEGHVSSVVEDTHEWMERRENEENLRLFSHSYYFINGLEHLKYSLVRNLSFKSPFFTEKEIELNHESLLEIHQRCSSTTYNIYDELPNLRSLDIESFKEIDAIVDSHRALLQSVIDFGIKYNLATQNDFDRMDQKNYWNSCIMGPIYKPLKNE